MTLKDSCGLIGESKSESEWVAGGDLQNGSRGEGVEWLEFGFAVEEMHDVVDENTIEID